MPKENYTEMNKWIGSSRSTTFDCHWESMDKWVWM